MLNDKSALNSREPQYAGDMVQTRLESISSISNRQVSDLWDVACCLMQTLSRLRGDHPEDGDKGKLSAPCGLIAEIEHSLQKKDELISKLNDIERELRSLL